MNIIIIEDELRTAKSLENIILGLRPEARIIGQYQSVESSVEALANNSQPDLIFMDIQLADGLSFDIFKSVKITCPVVFCTAFDEYSLEAFKRNGVDYVLKPFSTEDIREAFRKVDELKNFFQQKVMQILATYYQNWARLRVKPASWYLRTKSILRYIPIISLFFISVMMPHQSCVLISRNTPLASRWIK